MMFFGVTVIIIRTLSTGGVDSPVLLWVSPLPFLVSSVSLRDGVAWTLLLIASVFLVLFAEKIGIPINHMNPSDNVDAAVIIILLLVSGSISYIYEKQRRNFMKNIREIRDQLESSRKIALVGELAGRVAHQVNNPLSIVLGKVNIMEKKSLENALDSVDWNKEIPVCQKNLLKISSVIESLRTFTRDDYLNNQEGVHLHQLVSEVIDELSRDQNSSYGIPIFNNVPLSHSQLKGSSLLIKQSINNLMTNSFEQQKNSKDSQIRILVEESGEQLILVLQESGHHLIDPQMEEILGSHFSDASLGEGMWIKFNIVKNIMNLHEGDFLIEKDQKDTFYRLIFPISKIT